MSFSERFRAKNERCVRDYERLSKLGDNPDAWDSLREDDLKQVVMVKCIEYGASQDVLRIRGLLALYIYAMKRLDVPARLKLLNQFIALTEERQGQVAMGLMMFLAGDQDPAILSTAALSLAVLFKPEVDDELAGPKFVVRSLLRSSEKGAESGARLGGILLLGDKRLLPLLMDAWVQLSEEARLELAWAKSGLVTESMVEFWLSCLEEGCSVFVRGAVVAAIAKLPVIAQVPFVLDVERVFPAYRDIENPLILLRRTSFEDYLEEIRPQLEALQAEESEPKLIRRIYEVWESHDEFRGIMG